MFALWQPRGDGQPFDHGRHWPTRKRTQHQPPRLEELEPRTLLSFLPATNYASAPNPSAVATGDFANNGQLDLVVVNAGSTGFNTADSLSILLGNGDGTFRPGQTFTADNPYAVAVGDFTGSGILDLAVTNWEELFSGTHGTVTIYLGNGDGTFRPGQIYDVGKGPSAIAVGDFTGSGILDLAVTNQNNDSVSVLLGNGDGTFRNAVEYAVGTEPDGVLVADLNGDGRADLAVTNVYSDSVSVLLGNGDGTFQPTTTTAVGFYPLALAAGDFHGDGILDLAVTEFDGDQVTILQGNGDGTFQMGASYKVGVGLHSSPSGVAAADFNGDGVADLVTANYISSDVSVLLGNGDGTFQAATNYNVDQNPISVAVGDFRKDGFPDVVTADHWGHDVSVLLNGEDWHPGSGESPLLVSGLPATREEVLPSDQAAAVPSAKTDAVLPAVAGTTTDDISAVHLPPNDTLIRTRLGGNVRLPTWDGLDMNLESPIDAGVWRRLGGVWGQFP